MQAFDVLGDPVRRRILEVLLEGPHTSGQIVAVIRDEFGISQSAVSQHLKVLRSNDFATVTVDGPRRVYALQAGPLAEVDAWLGRFRTLWAPTLDALALEVARGKRRRDEDP
ncbi:MAG: metalloregulator ArsR/SmtB family transcription factor [Myxococcota bacterium]